MGINVRQCNPIKMAQNLNAQFYTIETKTNLLFYLLTDGLVNVKTVKVIKREY